MEELFADIQKYLPDDPNKAKEFLYYVLTYLHLMHVGEVMNQRFSRNKVAVYYDRSKQFGKIAREAFDSFMDDPSAKSVSKYFITMEAMGWEDCVPLQAADLIVYEGMKRVDGSLQGSDAIRKSLQALLNNNRMPIWIEHFAGQNVDDLMTIMQNARDGRQLDEGVKSKLKLFQNH